MLLPFPSAPARRTVGRRRALGALIGALIGLAVGLSALPARAFECTAVPPCPESNPDCPDAGMVQLTQAWNQRCVPVWIRRDDAVFGAPGSEVLLEAAFGRWTRELIGTDFEVLLMGFTDQGAGFDVEDPDGQQNVVLSVNDSAEADVYFDDRSLLAITLTTFSTETGEILDADVVFNALDNRFGVVEDVAACLRGTRFFDIENTLVHEIGHFFGFDHVADRDATMYLMAERCEIKKRDLATDERSAMETVYAAGQPTRTCLPPESYDRGNVDAFRDQCDRALGKGCGCITSSEPFAGSASGAGGWGLVVGALAWFGWRRRRDPARAR